MNFWQDKIKFRYCDRNNARWQINQPDSKFYLGGMGIIQTCPHHIHRYPQDGFINTTHNKAHMLYAGHKTAASKFYSPILCSL
jgi:hypothetical protein